MKKIFIKIVFIIFSISTYSQGITSIYSFKVEDPSNIQTIISEMTNHFETDFAKAGAATVEIVDEHFNGIEDSNLSFVYKFSDVQEMQDEYARTNSSKEFQEINQLLTPLIKENSQTLLKNLVGGKGQGNTGVTMVFVMKVNNASKY